MPTDHTLRGRAARTDAAAAPIRSRISPSGARGEAAARRSTRDHSARAGKTLWIGAVCCALAIPLHAGADNMSLSGALDLADRNNERSEQADLKVEVAEGQEESARGAFLPSLTLGLSGSASGHEDHSGNHVSGSGTLTLRQPIVKPSAIPLYRASKYNLDAAKAGATSDVRSLEYDTARAFVAVVGAQRVVTAANARLDRAKADLADAEARAEAELNSSNDSTRAKLDVSSAKRTVTSSQAALDKARMDLALLIGSEVTMSVDEPTSMMADAAAFIGVSADLSKEAQRQRPDLQSLHDQTLAAKASADEPMYRLIPSLDFTAVFQAAPVVGTGNWDSETASLTLTWTIFDGGVRYGDKRSKDAQARQAELNESSLSRSIDTSVKEAVIAVSAAQETLKEAQHAVEIAQANSDETEELYKQGLARAIELTDANGSRFDAEVSYAQAQLDLAQAYLNLRFALGLPVIDGRSSQ